ncbi:MAG: DDE-type integrase/transposase/recombinase [Sphingomonadaceae bacterium]|nr:DDE-type integrase/transposase/recombinase [Sphingomonadaceae bacterium]
MTRPLLRLVTADFAPAAQPRSGRGRPAGSGWFDRHPQAVGMVRSLLTRNSHASAADAHELLQARYGGDAPSYRTVRYFVADFRARHGEVLTRLHDSDGYRSRHMLAAGDMAAEVSRPHQLWEIDATKMDVMTSEGRKTVLVAVDVWSRDAVVIVDNSESSEAVRKLLLSAILYWRAVPEAIRTDNGSGLASLSVKSAAKLLGIEMRYCLPGQPYRKPFVEAFIRTLMHAGSRLIPGYTGPNVAAAQRLRSQAKRETGRAVITGSHTPQEAQRFYDAYLAGRYRLRPHGATGEMPAERVLRWPEGYRPAELPDRNILIAALAEDLGEKTVRGKQGLVHQGHSYWSECLIGRDGERVRVRRMEDDIGRLLVFDQRWNLIGEALNHEALGLSKRDFAIAAGRKKERAVAELQAELLAAARRWRPEEIIWEARAAKAEMLAPALDRAPEPLAPIAPPRPKPQLIAIRPDVAERVKSALTAEPAAPTLEAMTPAERMRWVDSILARAAAGEPVEERDFARANMMRGEPEYRAQKRIEKLFSKAEGNLS